MTNPKHTDTIRSGDLVAAMKDQLESWEFEDPRETWWKWQHQYAQAADRIEFLSERADALALQADEWEGKYQIVSEMNERLREAGKNLNWYAGHTEECGNGTWSEPIECDCGYTDAWKQWGAALGDTK